jgi:lysine 2,3-aminomutase
MDRGYRRCPIRLQGVPRIEELELDTAGLRDPLNEEANSPVPGLIHRYPDRVLLLVTNRCPMYCRHCTRRRIVGDEDLHLSREDMDRAFEYIRKTRGIRDVFISGGEPFAMSDERIGYVLGNLRKIPHVEIIRIATRAPVVLPQRITPGLVETLRKHHTRLRRHPVQPSRKSPRKRRRHAIFSSTPGSRWETRRSCFET